MSAYGEWFERLLERGEAILSSDMAAPTQDDITALGLLLRKVHHLRSLDIAGPPLPFATTAALNAARTLLDFCRILVGEPPFGGEPVVERPGSAAEHFAEDLCFRFLPAVARRFGARESGDPHAAEVARILKNRPLSAVLGDILEPVDADSVDFFGHYGLQLLYAERLAEHPTPATGVPESGATRELIEQVFTARGKTLPLRRNVREEPS